MSAETFKVLELDANDILVRVIELPAADYPEGAELLPRYIDLRPHGGDCDAAPGRYRWDRSARRLEPLEQLARTRGGAGAISTETAFKILLDELERQGLSLNDSLKAWRAQFSASVDAHQKKKGR